MKEVAWGVFWFQGSLWDPVLMEGGVTATWILFSVQAGISVFVCSSLFVVQQVPGGRS